MKRLFSALCCLSLVTIPAFAQHHRHPTTKAAMHSKTPMSDQQFVDFAAQTDMVEANLGKLAQQVSPSQPVQNYGQMLVTDHTQNYDQLNQAAKQANLTVPNAIDTDHNKTLIGPFHKLKGKAFDRKFVPEMISGHTKAIAIFKAEAQDASSQPLKAYAEASIPVLQKHLDAAKDLEKNHGK